MRTTTKWMTAVVAVAALLGVGLAAAQPPSSDGSDASAPGHAGDSHGQGKHLGWWAKLKARLHWFHRHPAAAMQKVCDGNMTVDECAAYLKAKVADLKAKVQQAAEKKSEACLQQKSKDYCDGRLDQFKADHPRIYGNQ